MFNRFFNPTNKKFVVDAAKNVLKSEPVVGLAASCASAVASYPLLFWLVQKEYEKTGRVRVPYFVPAQYQFLNLLQDRQAHEEVKQENNNMTVKRR